jgi:hypothetical protein
VGLFVNTAALQRQDSAGCLSELLRRRSVVLFYLLRWRSVFHVDSLFAVTPPHPACSSLAQDTQRAAFGRLGHRAPTCNTWHVGRTNGGGTEGRLLVVVVVLSAAQCTIARHIAACLQCLPGGELYNTAGYFSGNEMLVCRLGFELVGAVAGAWFLEVVRGCVTGRSPSRAISSCVLENWAAKRGPNLSCVTAEGLYMVWLCCWFRTCMSCC